MVKRHDKGKDGRYHIDGTSYAELEGSRAKVMHGTAYKTSGGLKKSQLKKNKSGKIVSIKKSKTAKKEKRLEKAGYTAKKGKFGAVKIDGKTKRRKGKKSRKSRKA
tara:strand:- start:780 stop:1097 length:318 start_codon:yes stop_codon:yes gene_type:complete